MPLNIINGSILKQNVDIIVNAANGKLQSSRGVSGKIFAAAGRKELSAACTEIGGCQVGGAVYTSGFKLSKYIIHAVGPAYIDGKHNEEHLLKSAYLASLKLADELEVESIAFPLISTGICGYPKQAALLTAVEVIGNYLENSDLNVSIVIYNEPKGYITPQQEGIFDSLVEQPKPSLFKRALIAPERRNVSYNNYTSYQMANYDEEAEMLSMSAEPIQYSGNSSIAPIDFDKVLSKVEKTFTERLFELIDEKEMSDTEVYKRANIDRKLFSKIRSDYDYKPSKNTCLALAIGLRLSIDETNDLLSRAGYILSKSSKQDVIIAYYIERENYNIHQINETLFVYKQKLLGSN